MLEPLKEKQDIEVFDKTEKYENKNCKIIDQYKKMLMLEIVSKSNKLLIDKYLKLDLNLDNVNDKLDEIHKYKYIDYIDFMQFGNLNDIKEGFSDEAKKNLEEYEKIKTEFDEHSKNFWEFINNNESLMKCIECIEFFEIEHKTKLATSYISCKYLP